MEGERIRFSTDSSGFGDDIVTMRSSHSSERTDFSDFPSPSEGSVITPDSSLMNFYQLEDDLELDSRDLVVRVDNPEKHSSPLESYVTFRVTTKTTRSDFDAHEYSVRRRYNDFFWLKHKLEESHPSCIVPPLPEKYSLQQFQRFNQEFLRTRMLGLHQFINRVADHPTLCHDENLKVFLTAKAYEFTAHRKKGGGIMSRMTDTLQNIAAPYMIKNRDPEFTSLGQYVQLLGEKLGCLERISQRIHKEQIEYASELNELHPVFTLWASSETQLGPGLLAISGALEKCAAAQKEVTSSFKTKSAPAFHEQTLRVESVKDALKRRDAAQTEYELTTEALNKRKQEKQELQRSEPSFSFGVLLGKSAETVKQEKEEKLTEVIEQLIKKAEENNMLHQNMNAELKDEIEKWHSSQQAELKQIYLGMIEQQLNFYKKCLSSWEGAISALKKLNLSEEGAEPAS